MPVFDFDLSVYLVTDRRLLRGRSLTDTVERALIGGTTIVQLREKQTEDAEAIELGRKLLKLCNHYNAALIVNDHLDWCKAIGAHGLHIGQQDESPAHIRNLLGPDKILGVSVSTVNEALAAKQDGADYISVSPVYDTPTKTDTPTAAGLDGLRAIRKAVDTPLVGIGGLDLHNSYDAIYAGLDGVSVIRAILDTPDPADAARDLAEVVARAKRDRR